MGTGSRDGSREVRLGPGREMRVLVVRTRCSEWDRLHQVLERDRCVETVGEVWQGAEVSAAVTARCPDIVLLDALHASEDTPALMDALRAVDPKPLVAVIGNAENVTAATMLHLRSLGVNCVLTWDQVSVDGVPAVLGVLGIGELVVGTRHVLDTLLVSAARQHGHVQGVVSCEQERALLAHANQVEARVIHCALWEENPDITVILQAVFEAAGIGLDSVATAEELIGEAARGRPGDFLFIDCSRSLPEETARCLRIVTHVKVPVHIIHSDEEVVDRLRLHARVEITHVHPRLVGTPLLDRLRLLKVTACSETPSEAYERLDQRERAVLRLVAEGRSDLRIAEELQIGDRTASRIVALLRETAKVADRKGLVDFYRPALQDKCEGT